MEEKTRGKGTAKKIINHILIKENWVLGKKIVFEKNQKKST